MSFEKANNKSVNPNFYNSKDEIYKKNCQSCIACFEARLRGYDLKAKGNNGTGTSYRLSIFTEQIWILMKMENILKEFI